MARWQYQILAEPIAQLQTNQIWEDRQTATPNRRLYSQFLFALFAVTTVLVPKPIPPSLSSWVSLVDVGQSRQLKDQSYITDFEFSPAIQPFVKPDSWLGQYPNYIWRTPPRSYINVLELILDNSQRPETTKPDKWHPILLDNQSPSLKDQSYITDFGFSPAIQPLVKTDWIQPVSQPLNRVQRRVPVQEVRVDPIVSAEIVTIDKWIGNYPNWIDKKPSRVWINTIDLVLDNSQRPERITPDKWTGEYPDKIDSKKSTPHLYPYFFAPLVQPLPRWDGVEGYYPDIIWKLQNRNYVTGGDLQLTNTQRPEAVSVDRWMFPVSQPYLYRIPRQFESLFKNPYLIPSGEIVTLDKWFTPLGTPVFIGKARQFESLFLSPFVIVIPEGPITIDKWYRQLEKPIFTLKHLEYLYQFYATSPLPVTFVAPGTNLTLFFEEGRPVLKLNPKFQIHI